MPIPARFPICNNDVYPLKEKLARSRRVAKFTEKLRKGGICLLGRAEGRGEIIHYICII